MYLDEADNLILEDGDERINIPPFFAILIIASIDE